MVSAIIIDGAEQQGKSTFVKNLSKELNIKNIFHFGIPDKNFNFIESYFNNFIPNETIICDRHYMSELCYGKLKNRNNINNQLITELENRLNKLNIIYVIVEMNKQWINRKEYINESENETIKQYFRYFFNKSNLKNKLFLNPLDSSSLNIISQKYKELLNEN
jgi:cytidylate kinase